MCRTRLGCVLEGVCDDVCVGCVVSQVVYVRVMHAVSLRLWSSCCAGLLLFKGGWYVNTPVGSVSLLLSGISLS